MKTTSFAKMELINNIKAGIVATSSWEWLAVVFSLSYVVLAAKKNSWCWLAALISTGIYIFLCYSGKLFIEAGLQVFYFAMAIYGWIVWKKPSSENEKLIKWPLKLHLQNILISSLLAITLGFVFNTYTQQASAYLDAFITCFSLVATYMVAKKVLDNWLYWIVIDFASIFLYAGRELYLTAILFLIFTLFATYAYISWLKEFKKQNA